MNNLHIRDLNVRLLLIPSLVLFKITAIEVMFEFTFN